MTIYDETFKKAKEAIRENNEKNLLEALAVQEDFIETLTKTEKILIQKVPMRQALILI